MPRIKKDYIPSNAELSMREMSDIRNLKLASLVPSIEAIQAARRAHVMERVFGVEGQSLADYERERRFMIESGEPTWYVADTGSSVGQHIEYYLHGKAVSWIDTDENNECDVYDVIDAAPVAIRLELVEAIEFAEKRQAARVQN